MSKTVDQAILDSSPIYQKFIVLQTQHLTLHSYKTDDLEEMLTLFSDPITLQFWPQPWNRETVEIWIKRSQNSYQNYGFGRYKITETQTGELVGDAGIIKSTVAGQTLNDLGYIIHHSYWGKGYGTEVALFLKDYAFTTLNLDQVYANMPYNHHASRRVAEKIGMNFVKSFQNPKNRNIETLLYVAENPTNQKPGFLTLS